MSPIHVTLLWAAGLGILVAYLIYQVISRPKTRNRAFDLVICFLAGVSLTLFFWLFFAGGYVSTIAAQTIVVSPHGKIIQTYAEQTFLWDEDFDHLLEKGELLSYRADTHYVRMYLYGLNSNQPGCVTTYTVMVAAKGSPEAALKCKGSFKNKLMSWDVVPWLNCELYALQEQYQNELSEMYPSKEKQTLFETYVKRSLVPRLPGYGLTWGDIHFE